MRTRINVQGSGCGGISRKDWKTITITGRRLLFEYGVSPFPYPGYRAMESLAYAFH